MKNRILCLFLALVMMVGILVSCGPSTPPACTECIDTDEDGLCDVCQKPVEPDDGGECSHVDEDGNDECDLCEMILVQSPYTWELTKLKFALNLHSHNGELSSGSKRYLAGGDSDGSKIVESVIARNIKAGLYSNTTIEYDYWNDGADEYDWNNSHNHIETLIKNDSTSQPDMYSTFLYDMMAASLDRSLANLKTTRQGANHFSFVKNSNYAQEVGDSEGYMMEFMESLTLSASKMYLLGSDFFTDTVRAFFLVPANVDLLNSLDSKVKEKNGGVLPTTGAFKDRTGPEGTPDGKFTVDDFIQLIWDREWTYDAITEFSEAVYYDADNSGGKTAKDILGFVLETGSGFSASGVLFTSSFTIIEKELVNGVWEYSYPAIESDGKGGFVYNDQLESNANALALFDLESKVQTLFSSTGVFASANDMKAAYGTTAEERDLVAIRRKFADGSLLFGGLIITGNLEDSIYSDFKNNTEGGFAIAPGPLYTAIKDTEYHSDTDLSTLTQKGEGKDTYYVNANGDKMSYRDYQTLMHNTGRLGGISVNTRKFSQCTAFLDYQSTHSTEILEKYYEENLTRAAAGTENGNDDVMRFIRDHVRSIFDKAFEDAISYSYSKDNPAATTWHSLIKKGGFQPNAEIQTNYSNLAVEKQKCLEQLTAAYEALPEIKER